MKILIMFVWLVMFTVFDIIGFRLDGFRGSVIYRVAQFLFQSILTFLVWRFFGWQPAVGANVAWYLLFCDVLYYALKGIQLTDFNWFITSPIVFYYVKLKHQVAAPVFAVQASAVAGFLIGLLICLFL